MNVLGKHAIANLTNCTFKEIDNVLEIENVLKKSAEEAGLHIVDVKFHKFEPIGISGMVVLEESHIAIHTWPEYKFVAVDAFTCGKEMNPEYVCKLIAKKLDAKIEKIETLYRGIEEA